MRGPSFLEREKTLSWSSPLPKLKFISDMGFALQNLSSSSLSSFVKEIPHEISRPSLNRGNYGFYGCGLVPRLYRGKLPLFRLPSWLHQQGIEDPRVESNAESSDLGFCNSNDGLGGLIKGVTPLMQFHRPNWANRSVSLSSEVARSSLFSKITPGKFFSKLFIAFSIHFCHLILVFAFFQCMQIVGLCFVLSWVMITLLLHLFCVILDPSESKTCVKCFFCATFDLPKSLFHFYKYCPNFFSVCNFISPFSLFQTLALFSSCLVFKWSKFSLLALILSSHLGILVLMSNNPVESSYASLLKKNPHSFSNESKLASLPSNPGSTSFFSHSTHSLFLLGGSSSDFDPNSSPKDSSHNTAP
ncbi:uncharacterized protein [Spinacia oleracea]|uniref:Uncharacterized protein isoform X1 n=1 Tax=Spinacia oleracea TaxID=3562 RepID=A0ABM3QG84_SPIOL|nr:uncharacterized protein LOC130459187 isoform X1 [Spinacia oleracea]